MRPTSLLRKAAGSIFNKKQAALCNFLRIVLHTAWLIYIAFAILAVGSVYTAVSHYALKKKSK